jgi:PAS domain S-box-containing protein
MNFFAWFSLLTSGVSLTLGLFVYFIDKKALVNKLFMSALVLNAYWAFTEFMRYQAATLADAIFWSKALFIWPFFAVLLLHFSLAYTESDFLKNKITYILLYTPAIAFAVTDLTTDLISAPPVLQPWGYTFAASSSWVATADGLWASTLSILALFFCVTYYSQVSEPIRKQQTKFVAIGLAFPVFLSLITDSILPMLGIAFPSLGNFSGCIFSAFIAFAIWRYGLFHLNPEVAAQNILSAMPDSLVLVNPQGKIAKVNDAFLKFSGYTEKEVAEIRFAEVFSDKKIGEDTLAALAEINEVKNVETVLATKSGETRNVVVSGSVVKSKSGRGLGFAFVIHDITQRKQMEAKLVSAERFASIGQLAGMIGHDLRSPLSSINAATYYLKKNYADDMDTQGIEMLTALEQSIGYCNTIISDLLDYSREIQLEPKATSLKPLLNNCFYLVNTPSNIEVVNNCQDTSPLSLDTAKVSRVIVNLFKNAFEAMPDGGKLTISSRETPTSVELTIQDTGVGMTPETLDKIWTPLFTTKSKGMGFGLAICKRIIEAHGGKIEAESQLEKGTTVKLLFPLKQPAPSGSLATSSF